MKKSKKRKTGPKPEIVKIEGDWRIALKESLKVKKPVKGWPK
jgi:hypothetical protein